MNTFKIDGDRNGSKGQIQEKWSMLLPEDLQYVKGRHDEWYNRIQKRTGETREAIENAIKEVFSSCSWHASKTGREDQASQVPMLT